MLKKILIGAGIFCLLILAITGGLYGFYKFQKQSSAVGFTQYEPAYLPDGITMTTKTIEIWENQRNKFAPNKILRIETSDPSLSIGVEKVMADYTQCAGAYDCQQISTPNGMLYDLWTTVDYDGTKNITSRQTAFFIIGTTHLWLDNRDSARTITQEEFGKIIDSFQKRSYKNLPTKYFVPGA